MGNGTVGVRFRQCYNTTIKNCTFDNMLIACFFTTCHGIVVDNIIMSNSKNGLSVGTSHPVLIKNSHIETSGVMGYGIRADGNYSSTDEGLEFLTVENCTVKSDAPIVVRKATGVYNLTLSGTNTLITSKDYQIIVTNNNDEQLLQEPTGTITITGAEGMTIYQ